MADEDNSTIEQLAKLLQNLQTPNQTQSTSHTVNLSTKLSHNNYSIWARHMKMAIGARGKLVHITGKPEPPAKESPTYARWEQDDLLVCSWILDNMEPDMVVNFAEYPSAKELWNGLEATYSQGSEGIQIYELNVKANIARQGTESIEDFYSRLQRIWRDIESRQPNPMVCSNDINMFNRLRSESKLYQFLAGIGEEYEAERRDLLKQDPLPSPEAAYAAVRRERDRKIALGINNPSPALKASGGIGTSLVASPGPSQTPIEHHEAGQCLLAGRPQLNRGPGGSRQGSGGGGRGGVDRSLLRCSNCGKPRHTKEECYFLVGFPEGWGSKAPPRDTITAAKTTEAGNSDKRKGRTYTAAATMTSTGIKNPRLLVACNNLEDERGETDTTESKKL